MTKEARAARNAYMRKYRRENPEKIKQIKDRYWEKKAAEAQRKEAEKNAATDENH